MSVRNAIVLLLSTSTLLFLASCGTGNGTITNPTPPPTGGFSASDLNGTYVFSVSGTDMTGAPYAIAGTLTANGSGGITGGAFDLADQSGTAFASDFVADASVNSGGSYNVGVDGRGKITITTSSITGGFPSLIFDFVLSSSSQGQITEFDSFATGSGTLDLQTANVTPTGAYAFSLSGASGTSPWATVGNFTVTNNSTLTGFNDVNKSALLLSPDCSLTGTLGLGPSATPSTTINSVIGGTTEFSGTFDAIAIDATHLKFIEMDGAATLAGDGYSQTSTTFPTATVAFALEGSNTSGDPAAIGGLMTAGTSGITGTEDYNVNGETISSSPLAFTAASTADPVDAGRYTLTMPTGSFILGTTYAAYPSSGGLLLLEMDTDGITVGAGYSQTSGATFAATSQGFGLNLSGLFLSSSGNAEVDDIAEFTATPSGTTISGVIDENYTGAAGAPLFDEALSGTYAADTSGRYGLTAITGTNSSPGTLQGGLTLVLYAADGTNFPFVELDSNSASAQVAAGLIVLQSSTSSSSAVARQHMFLVHPLFNQQSRAKKAN
jgi:hypothetical protein